MNANRLRELFLLKNWRSLCLSISHVLFIIFGITLISVGASQYSQLPVAYEIDARDLADPKEEAMSKMALGIISLLVGAVGLAGCLLKRKSPIMVSTGLAVFSLALSMSAVARSASVLPGFLATSLDEMQEGVVDMYGGNNTHFTESIDSNQRQEKCCGYSGNEALNTFLLTPWYQHANSDDPPPETPQTLPDSCCITPGPACTSAVDLMDAREKGFVFDDDCLERIISRSRNQVMLTWVQYVMFCILGLICITLSVLVLIKKKR